MSSEFMPSERLAEVRAAYALEPRDPTIQSRLQLYELLAAAPRRWSMGLLAAHRARVGGTWREVRAARTNSKKAAGKRKAAALEEESAGAGS